MRAWLWLVRWKFHPKSERRESAATYLSATISAAVIATTCLYYRQWEVAGVLAFLGLIFLIGYGQVLSNHEFEE